MANMNQIVLIGRVGNSPAEELKNLGDGKTVLTLRLAVDRKYKDNQGEQITDWISCEFWNRQAEVLAEYVQKGELLSVTGSLKIDTWIQEGQKKQRYYVSGERFQMLSGKKRILAAA